MRLRMAFIFAALLPASIDMAAAQECYHSSILTPAPFMGNDGEVFKLADGSIWEVKYEYQYLYEYYPSVIICPSRSKLAIKGKTVNVQQIRARQPPQKTGQQRPSAEVIEAQIDGEFSGWEGETIFKLTNGEIWQQASYAYTYTYKYRPKVVILRTGGGYEMQVEGMNSRIRVRRIN